MGNASDYILLVAALDKCRAKRTKKFYLKYATYVGLT